MGRGLLLPRRSQMHAMTSWTQAAFDTDKQWAENGLLSVGTAVVEKSHHAPQAHVRGNAVLWMDSFIL